MSGGHGPEAGTSEHPLWCDQGLCQDGRHRTQRVLRAGDRDTHVVAEQTGSGVRIAVETWHPDCDIHAEEAMSWSLADFHRVMRVMLALLAEVTMRPQP